MPKTTSKAVQHTGFASRLTTVGIYGAMVLAALQSLYPIIWMGFGSLKRPNEMYTNVWGLPHDLQWGNYADAWRTGDIGNRVLNSVHVTGLSLALIAIIATPCAYAIARIKFPARE